MQTTVSMEFVKRYKINYEIRNIRHTYLQMNTYPAIIDDWGSKSLLGLSITSYR